MGTLWKRGLISLVAAGVLGTVGVAATDGEVDQTAAADFRVVVDKTKVEKGKDIIVTIDLLNSEGTLDNLEGLYGNTVEVKRTTTLEADITAIDNDISDGTAIYRVTEKEVGTDTLSFSVLIRDAEGDAKVLPPKTLSIQVVQPTNKGAGLEIVAIEPLETDDTAKKVTFDGKTDKNATIWAGGGFTVKVEAIKTKDNSTKDDEKEVSQNSLVKVKLINSSDSSCVVAEIGSDEMQDGLAYITVPAETVKAAGNYKIVAYTTTDNTDVDLFSDGERWIESAEYNLTVLPLEPAKVVLGGDTYLFRTKTGKEKNATIYVTLVDKYGNPANIKKVEETKVTLEATNSVLLNGSQSPVDIVVKNKNNTAEVNVSVNKDKFDDLLVDPITKVGKTTISIDKNDKSLENGESIDLDIYTHIIKVENLSGTACKPDENESGQVEGLEVHAGDVFTLCKDSKELKIKGEGDEENEPLKTGTPIKVTFDGIESIDTIIEDNNDTKLQLKTKGSYSTITIEYNKKDTTQYAPFIGTLSPELNMNASYPESIATYNISLETPPYSCDSTTEESVLDSITLDLKKDDNISLGANKDKLKDKDKNGAYPVLVHVEDPYGNAIDGTNGETIFVLSALLDDEKSIKLDGSQGADFNYSGKVGKTDTLTLDTALVPAKEIPVEIVDTTPTITKIELNLEQNSVLQGSYIPFSITVFDQYGVEMDDQNIDIVIGDTTIIKVRELNATKDGLEDVPSGEEVNASNKFFIKGLQAGTTTLTARNVAGTVEAQAEIEVDLRSLIEAQEESSSSEEATSSSEESSSSEEATSSSEESSSSEEATSSSEESSSSEEASSSSVAVEDPIAQVEDEIVAATAEEPKPISGYFKYYDFNNNGAYDPNDWAYKSASTGNVYQLLGTTPDEANPFGWKAVEGVDVTPPYSWLFVHYGDGPFDWAVVKPDCSKVFKLAGATENHTFSYDVDGDGTFDQLNLTCTIENGQIVFSKK